MTYQIITTRKEISYKKVFLSITIVMTKSIVSAIFSMLIVNTLQIQGITKLILIYILFTSSYLDTISPGNTHCSSNLYNF